MNSNQQKKHFIFYFILERSVLYLLSDSKPLCNQKNVHFVSILWYWWGSQLDHQSFSMHLTLTFIRWSTALYPIQMGHTTFKQWFPLGMDRIFEVVGLDVFKHRAQSSTSLMADLCHDINIISSSSRAAFFEVIAILWHCVVH